MGLKQLMICDKCNSENYIEDMQYFAYQINQVTVDYVHNCMRDVSRLPDITLCDQCHDKFIGKTMARLQHEIEEEAKKSKAIAKDKRKKNAKSE